MAIDSTHHDDQMILNTIQKTSSPVVSIRMYITAVANTHPPRSETKTTVMVKLSFPDLNHGAFAGRIGIAGGGPFPSRRK